MQAASHISAPIVKTFFSEMNDGAKLRRNGLYFQVTFIWELHIFPSSVAGQFRFCSLSF